MKLKILKHFFQNYQITANSTLFNDIYKDLFQIAGKAKPNYKMSIQGHCVTHIKTAITK